MVLTFYHLLLLLILIFASFFITGVHAYYRYSSSFSRHIGRRLQCGIIKRVTDVIPYACKNTCTTTLNCFSVNTYKYANGTYICELVKGSKDSYKNVDCFEWKTGWEHNEFEFIQTCPAEQKDCSPKQYKKALPEGWYQLGTTAFKLFPKHLPWNKAVAACIDRGAEIAQIRNEEENKFIALLNPDRKPGKPLPLNLRPLAHWKFDGTDKNLKLLGESTFRKDVDGITTVLHFPGTAGSYAETPSFDIRGTSFSISFWANLVRAGYVYSSWKSPHYFAVVVWKIHFAMYITTEHGRKDNLFNIPSSKNRWTHYTAVWDRPNATAMLYINGNKIYSKKYNEKYTLLVPTTFPSEFDVGLKRDDGYKKVINGSLSQLYLFDRVLTSKEVEYVRDVFYMGNSAWIGLNDINTEGRYETDNSQVASYLNFAPGQLENETQDCVSVRAWDEGRMDVNHCVHTVLPYFCMKQV